MRKTEENCVATSLITMPLDGFYSTVKSDPGYSAFNGKNWFKKQNVQAVITAPLLISLRTLSR